jgi:hypothetical protein
LTGISSGDRLVGLSWYLVGSDPNSRKRRSKLNSQTPSWCSGVAEWLGVEKTHTFGVRSVITCVFPNPFSTHRNRA